MEEGKRRGVGRRGSRSRVGQGGWVGESLQERRRDRGGHGRGREGYLKEEEEEEEEVWVHSREFWRGRREMGSLEGVLKEKGGYDFLGPGEREREREREREHA